MDGKERKSHLVGKREHGFYYGYIVVLAAFIIWMITWGVSMTYGVFFKPILSEFGWTRAMTAGARSLSLGVWGLMGIVTGRLTDRLGPRKVVLIAGCFFGIGYLLMSYISNAWQFYVIYGVVIGIGLSAVTVPTMTTVARWFVKRRGLMMGIMQTGGGIGGIALPPLAGWLILTYGWRSSYLILGILALALFILPGLFLKRDPGQIGCLPYGAGGVAGNEVEVQAANSQVAGFSLGGASRTAQFWMLSVMLFGFGFCRSAIITHIAVHTTDLGFSLTTGASILATISGVSIAGRIGMGRLADLIGNRYAFMIGYSVTAASLLWALTANELWTLYLFAIAFGFGWGTMAVIRVPMLAEVFGVGSLGSIFGILEAGTATGAILGPFLAGWLFDVTGQYTTTFLVAAAVAIISLVMTVLLKPISGRGGENDQRRSP